MAIASNEVSTVVQSKPAMPNRSWSPDTIQFREVKKLS